MQSSKPETPKIAYSIREAVAATSLSRTTIYNHISAKRLRAIRIGGRAIDMSVLEAAMEPVLDTKKIVNSPVPVNVGVTVLSPLSRMSVDLSKVEPEEVIPWMMRGGHLPIVGGAAPRGASAGDGI